MSRKTRPSRPSPTLLSAFLILVASTLTCFASQSVSVRWTANPETDISYYKVLYGTSAGTLNQSVSVSGSTSTVISGLEDDTTYHFALQAVNTAEMASDVSSVVDYRTAGTTVPNLFPELAVHGENGAELENEVSALSLGALEVGSGASTGTSVTITNTGDADLTGIAATITGSSAGDFTISETPASILAPGAQTTIKVDFTPSAVGSRASSLSIVSNDADESPFLITLTGTGTEPAPLPAPEISVEANGVALTSGSGSLALGSVVQGTGSAATTLTIRNTGSAALTGVSAVISGSHASDFAVNASPPSTIAAGDSSTLDVTFHPSALGARSATLTISSNDADEGAFVIPLAGTGLAVPAPEIVVGENGIELVAGGSSRDFGSVLPGGVSPEVTLTIRNTGSAELTSIATSLAGSHPGDFQVSSPASSLAAGDSTTITVRFVPTTVGARTAVLSIASNDADENPFEIGLAGIGLAVPEIKVAGPEGEPLESDQSSLDFGAVAAQTGSRTLPITIRNTGTGTLSGISAGISGGQSSEFTVASQPPAELAPGAEATISIIFRPAAGSTRFTSLQIDSSDPDEGSFTIWLTGFGTVAPQIQLFRVATVSAASAAAGSGFGEVDLGKRSPGVTYAIYNAGTGYLSQLALKFAGNHPGDFRTTSLATSVLAPGEMEEFTLNFAPSVVGGRNAVLQVFSNDPYQNPVELPVSGVGVGVPEIKVASAADGSLFPQPDAVDFGTAKTGSTGAELAWVIRNTGSGALHDLRVARGGAGAADFVVVKAPAATIEPGGEAIVRVRFEPKAVGAREARLRILSNDPDKGSLAIAVTGTATAAPAIRVSAGKGAMVDGDAYVTFGSKKVGRKGKTRNITITNTGFTPLKNLAIRKSWRHKRDFQVSKLKTSSLAPGQSTTVKITFKPKSKGNRWAAFHIASNDPDSRSFDITLNGVGTKSSAKKSKKSSKKSAVRSVTSASTRSAATKLVVHVDGERYRALKIRKSGNPDVRARDVQVSSDLIDWKSGARHTTVVEDNEKFLIVRDDTPLGGGKRHIRLNPRR